MKKLLATLMISLFVMLNVFTSAFAYGPNTGDVTLNISGVSSSYYGSTTTTANWVNLPFGNYRFEACVNTPYGWKLGVQYSYVSPNQAITVPMNVTQYNYNCTNYNVARAFRLS